MEPASVQKISKVLNILVTAAFICNLIALPLVPPMVYLRGNPFADVVMAGLDGNILHVWAQGITHFWQDLYSLMLAGFLLFSGCCTAVILWQGRRVLRTILRGEPFSMENAVSLRRAAVCSFLIAGAALARVAFSLWFYRSPAPLATYNALFVPIFAMFGLLCLVISALFRQAVELKAENDLTI